MKKTFLNIFSIAGVQMKRIGIIAVTLFLPFLWKGSGVSSQNIGINSTGNPPNASAALDIDFLNKGLLIPRVALTSSSDNTTIASPETSLLVYNTGAGGLSPSGYYYNSGTPASPLWISISFPPPSTSYCNPIAPGINSSGISTSSFDINWNSTTGANVYYVDISTNPAFSGFVSIYNNYNVGNLTSFTIYGLSCATTYYGRLRSGIYGCGTSINSNTVTVTTLACCACVSNTWCQKANFGGSARTYGVGFSIGNKAYIGTGTNSGVAFRDFWEWDQATDVWTQKADFGGTARSAAVGFSISTKGYIGTGVDAVNKQDFWEWDQATNVWTKKADFGGTARRDAVGFSIGTKGYIGTGHDGAYKQDFWEWDQATDVWALKTNFGGTARRYAVGFSIGTKGYIGTGFDGAYKQDFYEYDPGTNGWTLKANFGGTARRSAVGFSIGTKGYIGTGFDPAYKQDFYEYDPGTNGWTLKANFGGTTRYAAVSFSIGTKGYIGLGTDANNPKDFWEYCQ